MNTPHAFPDAWRRGVYEAIARRRDMHQFLPDAIAPEVIARILGAAHQAASVGFSQPWNFVLVENMALRRRVHAHVQEERLRGAERFEGERRQKYLSMKLEGILEGPVNICVTCDRSRFGPAVLGRNTVPDADLYSTCGAVQNLWLAARAEGVGVGWVSILQPEALRDLLELPDHVTPVAYLEMGYVETFPERPTLQTSGWLPRLPLEEIVYQDTWGQAPGPALRAALHGNKSERPQMRPTAHDPAQSQGQLLVYTGDGKGKTTAALGLVFRALGRNLPVAVVQFIKGPQKTGERLFAQTLPQLTFLVMGEGVTWESDDGSRDKGAAQEAWERAAQLILAGDHSLVVLDEITYAINAGFLSQDDVAALLAKRPAHVHVVLTGRNAPSALCAQADLVTEMACIKHDLTAGAQVGVDF